LKYIQDKKYNRYGSDTDVIIKYLDAGKIRADYLQLQNFYHIFMNDLEEDMSAEELNVRCSFAEHGHKNLAAP